MDKALLKSLNYVKRPALEKLFKDNKRVLATIQGDKPITVADLSAELSRRFYHGAERAADEKKINAQKQDAFDSLLYRRLLKEGELRKIAESDEFQRPSSRTGSSSATSSSVITPTVTVTEGEGKTRAEQKKSRTRRSTSSRASRSAPTRTPRRRSRSSRRGPTSSGSARTRRTR